MSCFPALQHPTEAPSVVPLHFLRFPQRCTKQFPQQMEEPLPWTPDMESWFVSQSSLPAANVSPFSDPEMDSLLDELLLRSCSAEEQEEDQDSTHYVVQRSAVSTHPAFEFSALGAGFRYLKPVIRKPAVKRKARQTKKTQQKDNSGVEKKSRRVTRQKLTLKES